MYSHCLSDLKSYIYSPTPPPTPKCMPRVAVQPPCPQCGDMPFNFGLARHLQEGVTPANIQAEVRYLGISITVIDCQKIHKKLSPTIR